MSATGSAQHPYISQPMWGLQSALGFAICPVNPSFLASYRLESDEEGQDFRAWHSHRREGCWGAYSPRPLLLPPLLARPRKAGTCWTFFPLTSALHLQAGPGCTWPSTKTPWRATCGCSRRTWVSCTSTMSSECPDAGSHARSSCVPLSFIPTSYPCTYHTVPGPQGSSPAGQPEDTPVMA